MWNVRNNDINITNRKSAANFGFEMPTKIIKSVSGPVDGITAITFVNHLNVQMNGEEEEKEEEHSLA